MNQVINFYFEKMRYWDKVILFLVGLIILSSCGSSKKVVYLQDADVNRRVKTEI